MVRFESRRNEEREECRLQVGGCCFPGGIRAGAEDLESSLDSCSPLDCSR